MNVTVSMSLKALLRETLVKGLNMTKQIPAFRPTLTNWLALVFGRYWHLLSGRTEIMVVRRGAESLETMLEKIN